MSEQKKITVWGEYIKSNLHNVKALLEQASISTDISPREIESFRLLFESIEDFMPTLLHFPPKDESFAQDERNLLKMILEYTSQLLREILDSKSGLNPNFVLKVNGTAINKLTQLKPKKSDMTVNRGGEATFKKGDFTLKLKDFSKIAGLKTSTHQLLDALMIERTKHGGKDLTIRLNLDDFMEMRGLKDRKEARKQVDKDLETLFNARLSWSENTGRGKPKSYIDMRLIESKGINRGVIAVKLTSSFAELLEGYYPMPYAKQTLKLSGKYNPNSYYFMNRIQQHKNMNIGKKNENLISVQTLLDTTPDIPTYEEVAEKNRRYRELIIEPFERDMDALDETLTWEYCHSNGVPLTDEELANMDYYTFEKLLIQIYWRAYPDQTERLERKFRRITEAKGKKNPSTFPKQKVR